MHLSPKIKSLLQPNSGDNNLLALQLIQSQLGADFEQAFEAIVLHELDRHIMAVDLKIPFGRIVLEYKLDEVHEIEDSIDDEEEWMPSLNEVFLLYRFVIDGSTKDYQDLGFISHIKYNERAADADFHSYQKLIQQSIPEISLALEKLLIPPEHDPK